MKTEHAKPFTVVVGVDYSELAELALEHAIRTARAYEHRHLHVVHVFGATASAPQVGTVVGPDPAEESARLREYVERVLTRCEANPPNEGTPAFDRVTIHIRFYDAAEAISQIAADVDADLVIVGTHGRRGVERLVMGSVAESTVRSAPCPVLVVRPLGSVSGAPVPKIEPACPRCLEARAATNGKEFWCEQHREQHDRRHTYHFSPNRSSHQSGLLFPF